jgi:hypothetical protein
MRLTQQQWFLVARAVSFAAGVAGDKSAKPILKLIGKDGRRAALKGVRPAPEITEEPDHERIGVDERAIETFVRLQEESTNVKAMLMELGNRLVREHRFKPAQAIFDRQRDATFLRSTQMIAMFIAWLNQVPEAQKIISEYGFQWPLGQQRRAKDDHVGVE